MKLTGQDQPLATPIVEEPSSGEEEAEATDEDVESFEDVDVHEDSEDDDEDEDEEEEIEEIIEEIIELSPSHGSPFRHNPLTVSIHKDSLWIAVCSSQSCLGKICRRRGAGRPRRATVAF